MPNTELNHTDAWPKCGNVLVDLNVIGRITGNTAKYTDLRLFHLPTHNCGHVTIGGNKM